MMGRDKKEKRIRKRRRRRKKREEGEGMAGDGAREEQGRNEVEGGAKKK